MGHLALADAFVITADSVSMLSEACSTGYVYWMIMRAALDLWLVRFSDLGFWAAGSLSML